MPAKEIVDLELHLHAETERAVLVSHDGFSHHAHWVPLSQCEVQRTPKQHRVVVTMPVWLATEKGFV